MWRFEEFDGNGGYKTHYESMNTLISDLMKAIEQSGICAKDAKRIPDFLRFALEHQADLSAYETPFKVYPDKEILKT